VSQVADEQSTDVRSKTIIVIVVAEPLFVGLVDDPIAVPVPLDEIVTVPQILVDVEDRPDVRKFFLIREEIRAAIDDHDLGGTTDGWQETILVKTNGAEHLFSETIKRLYRGAYMMVPPIFRQTVLPR